MSGTAHIDHISASALNDYDFNTKGRREWPWPTRCTHGKQTDRWRCGLDKSTLHPAVRSESTLVPTIHFLIKVDRDGGEDTYEFTALYQPWSMITGHPRIVSVAGLILVAVVIPTMFLFVRPLWNIRLYRALKLDQIDKIKIPGVGAFVHLVAVLPWFIKRQRTLDAWVLQNREIIRQAWESEPDGASQGPVSRNGDNDPRENDVHPKEVYIPLPIRKGHPRSGGQILQPGASDIRTMIASPRATMQIVGPGGAGKTTLARQIGHWGFENGLQSGIAAHPMIPIWVDEELHPSRNSLRDVVKGKLSAALPDEEIDEVLFTALLEKQRLLVFVDRLSERSGTTQKHIEKIYRSTKVGLLVVTSRTPHYIDGAQIVSIYPQSLNSATLLRFMTDLLPVFLGDGDEAKPFSTIEEQCQLGVRLAALIRVRTNQGDQDVPLIPLPVRLFVEQAVQLVRDGKPLDDLPVSLPEVYLHQLRLINPQDANLPHFVHNDRMVKVTKTLAKTGLGTDFTPKEFTRSEALAALKGIGESVTDSCDPVRRLVLNGVLIEKPGGIDIRLRFALDPIAEILAAVAYGEGCGFDDEKWEILMLESQTAPGFQAAIKLVRQAYWSTGREKS